MPALRSHTRQVVADFISLAPLLVVFWYAHGVIDSSHIMPIQHHTDKVPILHILGFITIAPCLIGMRLIAITARAQPAERSGEVAALERFVQLRADLKWFLAGAAAIISAATFANGAFRNAVNALNTNTPLPSTEVLLYGGFCSAVLALFYLSSHDAFRRSGWAIITNAESAHDATPAAWADAHEKKARLADILGLRISGLQVLRDSSVIAGPLLGSAFALLLA